MAFRFLKKQLARKLRVTSPATLGALPATHSPLRTLLAARGAPLRSLPASPLKISPIRQAASIATLSRHHGMEIEGILKRIDHFQGETVVSVSTCFHSNFRAKGLKGGFGSGVIISDCGYILTCAHVVSSLYIENGQQTCAIGEITIRKRGSLQSIPASVIALNLHTDLAVLKFDAAKGQTYSTIGGPAERGQFVVSISNPHGLPDSLTFGNVRYVDRIKTTKPAILDKDLAVLEHSCPVYSGSSGSPIYAASGLILGLHSFGFFQEADGISVDGKIRIVTGQKLDCLNYAIPYKPILEILQYATSERAKLYPVICNDPSMTAIVVPMPPLPLQLPSPLPPPLLLPLQPSSLQPPESPVL